MAATIAAPMMLMMGGSETSNPTLDSDPVATLGGAGIPPMAAEAYATAARMAADENPGCGVPVELIAAVGAIESGHGTHDGATMGDDGTISPAIIGPQLNGSGGFAAIADTDGGVLDGDTEWDRAVGPMQFIPSTWATYGGDANGDGRADPQNYFDATLATARYLCASSGGGSLRDDESAVRRSLLAYNRSQTYVNKVVAERDRILTSANALAPPSLGDLGTGEGGVQLATIEGVPVNAAIATQVTAMLQQARGAGVDLRLGNSYRSVAEQIELRRSNCGSSHYAIYEMASSACSPPTARPGRSNHQQGLAIDFRSCSSRSTACYQWLANNAAGYGLFNLPSEPWHWSVDGN